MTVLLISCARASRAGSSSSDAQARVNDMIAARKSANAEGEMSVLSAGVVICQISVPQRENSAQRTRRGERGKKGK